MWKVGQPSMPTSKQWLWLHLDNSLVRPSISLSQLNLCSAPLFIPAYYGPDNVLNLNHALQNQPQVIDLIHSVFPGARKIQERDEDQSWGTRTQVGTLLLELWAWREEGLLQCSRITVKVGSRVEIRAGKKKKIPWLLQDSASVSRWPNLPKSSWQSRQGNIVPRNAQQSRGRVAYGSIASWQVICTHKMELLL